jgi:hypothetical protein
MTNAEIKAEIANLEKRAANPNLPASAVAALNKKVADLKSKLSSEDDKKKAEPKPKPEPKPKAEKPKREPMPKAEPKPKSEAKGEKDEYDCDDLIAKAKERKRKSKAAAEKRKDAPKKSQATKNKEAVEKTSKRVEANVEKRAKKGDITVAEIEKIIAEYERAITKLRELLKKAKSEKKMALGGNLGMDYSSAVGKITSDACKCGDKYAKGGSVGTGEVFRAYGDMYMLEGYTPDGKKMIVREFPNRFGNNFSVTMDINAPIEKVSKAEMNEITKRFFKRKSDSKAFGNTDYLEKGGKVKPKMVRSQFEEEEFEYESGGNLGMYDRKKILPTPYKGIGMVGGYGRWNILDLSGDSPAVIGSNYKSKTELLMDLKSEMEMRGYEKMGQGGDVAADRKYSAMKAGRRIGKKVSKIVMSDGSKFKRRNMNQYGQAGGGEYYESRRNRTDRRKTL